jgi:hypothetical protein
MQFLGTLGNVVARCRLTQKKTGSNQTGKQRDAELTHMFLQVKWCGEILPY